MAAIDTAQLMPWIGNEMDVETVISAERARLMAATLDRDLDFQKGDPLPPAWHWLYFHEPVRASEVAKDGHAKRGGFLPPVPLSRRMWAGGHLTFVRPLRIGDRATKRSTIKAITPKQGRSGALCFVIVGHEVSVGGRPCLAEEQTLVYAESRGPGAPAQGQPAPPDAPLSLQYVPDPVLLFRYSALTFNSHRIHYDVDYCRQVEGYPDLVVHGPLIATLLLDLVYYHYPKDSIEEFTYRAYSPLFSGQPFTVNSARSDHTARVWAANHAGDLATDATVEFGDS